ncbi:hypothetical protein [Chamaesiphon minutus]|nr:hypothetical protein [Chamaesiphon minutus]
MKSLLKLPPHVDSKFEFPNSRWATVSQNSQSLMLLRLKVSQNLEF